jgi:hypothetical protein
VGGAAAAGGGQALLLLTMPFVAAVLVLIPEQPIGQAAFEEASFGTVMGE